MYTVHVSHDAVFGGEKRSHMMPIQVSSVTAAHNSLWVGTENGILITFPFNAPSIVAEETGWEVIKVHVLMYMCMCMYMCIYMYMYMYIHVRTQYFFPGIFERGKLNFKFSSVWCQSSCIYLPNIYIAVEHS